MDRENLRSLALRKDGIGHPFRQNLPFEMAPIAKAEHVLETSGTTGGKWLGEDVSLFILSFLAFFTAFYTFIF
tara:strand:+ start:42835 stop:43053 length:219 start_codon:yes stop_codon:yes gene_type:complete